MKKRLILIPLALFTAVMAGLMKLIWDALSSDESDSRRYDTIRSRVNEILKVKSAEKQFDADMLIELLDEPRDIIESAFGMSIESVITHHRLTIAERLLRSTDDTISCIAETAGFGDSGAMYKPFSKQYGMAPTQYRETHRR